MDAKSLLRDIRLVPVVAIGDAASAVPLAKTLLEAGIGAIEVTLRTDSALESIRRIAIEVPDILCGAGSLRRPEQVAEVIGAGARFGVSPGSSGALLKACTDFPFVPGAETATEVIALLDSGYTLQKFFPAELNGGLAKIDALTAPLPEVMFFPTGGITEALAADYLAHPRVHCVGGSWFVPSASLVAGDFDAIAEAAASAVHALQ